MASINSSITCYSFTPDILDKITIFLGNDLDESVKDVALPIFAQKLADQTLPELLIKEHAQEAALRCTKPLDEKNRNLLTLMFTRIAILLGTKTSVPIPRIAFKTKK